MRAFTLALAAALIFSFFCVPALADQRNYGCGLGSMMIDNDESLVSQTAAMGLNACFGSQLFGVSSGTSNCDKPDSLFASEKVNKFVADNMDNLAGDIARGKGEYLETFAELIEVPQDERPELYAHLQSNFSSIYPSPDTTHNEVIENIAAVM